MSIDWNEIKANNQRIALYNAIQEFAIFIRYAEQSSRFAIPMEADDILESLLLIKQRMYGEPENE